MHVSFLCVTVLAFALIFSNQAESKDLSIAERILETEVDDIVQPFEEEVELFQGNTQAMAMAYPQRDFAGLSRTEDTPLVIQGHNQVASLKVPAGQCVALFTHAGYNRATSDGQMLKIRGPMHIPSLASYTSKQGSTNWSVGTHSYKMGPCTAETTVEVATNAIHSTTGIDLSALSHAAKSAEEGTRGTITHAFTHIAGSDGVAHPYSEKTVQEAMETGMKVVSTDDNAGDAAGVALKLAGAETTPSYTSGGIKPLVVDLPFPKKEEQSDLKDILKDADKDAEKEQPCDADHGCVGRPAPCADASDVEVCEDYVARGDCQFDFAQKDCQKSCGLCPSNYGAVASDARVSASGHYFLGESRRRVGAGYGRRRRSPLKSDKKDDKKEITEKVPTAVSVIHPNGVKTVVVKKPPANVRSCKECVQLFKDEKGCEVWKKGADPTHLVGQGCLHCSKETAEACGMLNDDKKDDKKAQLPEPIEHPGAASKELEKSQKEDTKNAEKDVPKAMATALKKVDVSSEPSTTDKVIAKLKEDTPAVGGDGSKPEQVVQNVIAKLEDVKADGDDKSKPKEDVKKVTAAVVKADEVVAATASAAAAAQGDLAVAEKEAASATSEAAAAVGGADENKLASVAATQQAAVKVLKTQADEATSQEDAVVKTVIAKLKEIKPVVGGDGSKPEQVVENVIAKLEEGKPDGDDKSKPKEDVKKVTAAVVKADEVVAATDASAAAAAQGKLAVAEKGAALATSAAAAAVGGADENNLASVAGTQQAAVKVLKTQADEATSQADGSQGAVESDEKTVTEAKKEVAVQAAKPTEDEAIQSTAEQYAKAKIAAEVKNSQM